MWYPGVSDATLTGVSFSSVSGELQMTGSAAKNTVLGTSFITNRNIVTAPFTIETTLEWTSGMGGLIHIISLYILQNLDLSQLQISIQISIVSEL